MSSRRRLLAAVLTLAATLLAAVALDPAVAQRAAAPKPAATPADWPTYHGDSLRTGRSATMPTAQGSPHILKQIKLDGAVYASPIVTQARTIIATENNTVYSFGPEWKHGWIRHLGAPSPASERPCGNIDPLGITGTPVYSSKYDAIYVVAQLRGSNGNPPRHVLYSLDRKTGRTKWQRSLDLPGVDAVAMQQRGALTIAGNQVFVPFGGLAGDCGNYKGRVIGTSRVGTGPQTVFTVPTAREGGIWTPPGASLDAYGHLYVSVGNGAAGRGDRYDYTDSVLRLSAGTLKLTQHFSPQTWQSDNDADLDLGSLGPSIVAGHWILAVGKSGTGYVLHKGALGGVGGALDREPVCAGAYGGTAVYGHDVYVPCNDGLRNVYVDNTPSLHVQWRAPAQVTGSPVLGGGRVWSLSPYTGELYSLRPADGKVLSRTTVGETSRFATPSIYGRTMVVPTLTGITVVTTS